MAPLTVSVQLSLGRFAVSADDADTIKALKTKLRTTVPSFPQINFKAYRFNAAGVYLSDESKTLKELEIADGAVLHAVKKSTCPRAAIDTEKPAADE
jgi:hypothetical protein